MSDQSFNPIELGGYVQESFAQYLLGSNQRGYQKLLQSIAEHSDYPEEELIRSKGPFLQGVPQARMGNQTWRQFSDEVNTEFAPGRLEPEIVDAMEDVGFKHLFKHQQEAIKALTDNEDTLISAGTGRGKTEAWFIPILQYALRAKREKIQGHPSTGVKAILTYPTKALAQDQLKRFIEYLWLVNEHTDLPKDEQLTIGIFDGDTPSKGIRHEGGKTTHTVLEEAYEYFELPDSLAKELAESDEVRESESPRVNVKKEDGEFFLETLPQYGSVRLDFVSLTRDKITENPPDILLTNPDTINYRLFNINNEKEQHLMVDQPKFLVFDEVHTYEGLFGAHVAWLIQRLRRLRAERDVEHDLRLVASSATMDEREVFFQRLFSVAQGEDYQVVTESLQKAKTDPENLPPYLYQSRFDEDTLEDDLSTAVNGGQIKDHPWISDLVADPTKYDEAEDLLEKALEIDLVALRHLHSVIQDPTEFERIADAPRFGDFAEYIEVTYGLSDEKARTAAANSLTLFELADLEVRVHLFNWPIDGYYKCLECHTVYNRPRECDCGTSASSYVTKIRLDEQTGEHIYEGWFCSECGYIQPVRQDTEGEYIYSSRPECPHPDHDIPLQQIYWQPEYRCENCNTKTHPDAALESCEECGAKLTRSRDKIVCKNPQCGRVNQNASDDCPECGGESTLAGEIVHSCPNNHGSVEHVESESGELRCGKCDARLTPQLRLPFVCTNEEFNHTYYQEAPPGQCDCNRSTFVLPAYFDTNEADYCPSCNETRSNEVYHVAGTSCKIQDHETERRTKSFNLRSVYIDSDGNWRLIQPSKASHALPCYHGHNTRFDPLLRAPTSTGVTMGQFMLRRIADENDAQRTAKLLSFADSYRDMERLNNDFDEPEKLLFVQQALLKAAEKNSGATLREISQNVQEIAESYWDELEVAPRIIDDDSYKEESVFSYPMWQGTLRGELLPGSYRRFRGTFERANADLVRDGLLDIDLTEVPSSPGKRLALAEILEQNGISKTNLLETLRNDPNVDTASEVLRSLEKNDVIYTRGTSLERVHISLDVVEVHFVDSNHGIPYNPWEDRFYSSALKNLGEVQARTVEFTTPYQDRHSTDSPYFNRIAFMAAESSLRFLLSEVYKGDIGVQDRRRLEHQFKRNSAPNFLSSGPAMEVGIDIGDLNSLLLHGTPPNTNAYLQRIGRAGRRVGKSLITTVSKRDPIDYYYHKRPEKLIVSSEQPIPLDQHNEQAMKVELTWAIMDYIAANYHIPWKSDESMDGGYYVKDPSNWSEYAKETPRSHPPEEYESFNSVYYSKTDKTSDGRILRVLHNIVEEDEAVRAWLEDLLDYAYCRNCDSIFDSMTTGTCQVCGENELRDAQEEYESLINDVLDNFTERIVRFAYDYHERLKERESVKQKELQEVQDELAELDTSSGFFDTGDESNQGEVDRLERRREIIQDELSTIRELKNDYDGSTLEQIHQRSSASGFVPQLRAFGRTVNIKRRYQDDPNRKRTETGDNLSRDEAMAVRELFPGAYVLRNKQGHVVTRVIPDTQQTEELRSTLGQIIRCQSCGTEMSDRHDSCPTCDALPSEFSQIEPISLQQVTMAEEEIANEQEVMARDIYPFSDHRKGPENTFAHGKSEVNEFVPDYGEVVLSDGDGQKLVRIKHGELELVETIDSFTTTYSNGQQDPAPVPIKICTEPNCNGVIVQNNDEPNRCYVDPTHDVDSQQEVVVGRVFRTKGLHVQAVSPGVKDTEVHSLLHGLRLALQRTGGVSIRSLRESYEHPKREGYIFEGTVGGNGVTQLLFNRTENEYPQLEEAIEIMIENTKDCSCDYGCPECVYQYGCDENNREQTLTKEGLVELLSGSGIIETDG